MSFARFRIPVGVTSLLVWALLWAPIWGQWHGIVHGTELALSAPAELHAEHEGHEGHEGHSHEEKDAKHVGHAAGSELCQVLDHQAHADSLNASQVDWSAPMVPGQAPGWRVSVLWGHDRWTLAQARAPPALI